VDEPPAGEAEAYQLLEGLRWGGAPDRCPHCGATGGCRYLKPRDGVRRTRTGAPTARRVWKCSVCRRQFSVLTGTVLAGSRVPVRTWLATLEAWGREGRPSAAAVAAGHGLTPEAARQLIRRVEATLGDRPATDPVRALLDVPTDEAARIRDRTPSRKRPRRQVGPAADYGRE
jgi:hypothetical protein